MNYTEKDKEYQEEYPRFNFGYYSEKDITKIFYDKNMKRWEIKNRMTTPDFVYTCRVCHTEYEVQPEVCIENDCSSDDFWEHDIWR